MLIGQLIFDGMVMGLVYVLLAAGLVLIISTSRVLFLAYGAFYTVGAYATWYASHHLHLPFIASVVIGVACSTALSMLSYVLIFWRLQLSRRGGFLATLIGSMGLSTVITQGGLLIYGTSVQSIPSVIKGTFRVLGVTITADKLMIIALGIVVTVLLFVVYEKTRFGRAMRAVAYAEEAAVLQGINAPLMYMLTLGMGCAIAGFAGAVLAPTYGISPGMGGSVLWTVLLMTMVGGMDSLIGAVWAGLIIGQILSFGQYFIGSSVQIVLFVLIGILLYFKPNGLLGRGVDIGV